MRGEIPERVYLPPEVARAMSADAAPEAGDILYVRAPTATQDYEPSSVDKDTARNIVGRCGIRNGLFKGPRTLNAVETIAYALLDARRSALSSRDTEIRQVLEGLRDDDCFDACFLRWMKRYRDSDGFEHSEACLTAAALYAKLTGSS